MKIRIVVADDHHLFRQGLCILLRDVEDIEVVGEARDGSEAVTMVRDLNPDIVLMDLEMPDMHGVEAIRLICEKLPRVKILVLSAHEDTASIEAAMQAGAQGYIVKRSDADDLAKILRATQRGEEFFSPYLVNLVYSNPVSIEADQALLSCLSEQEMKILTCLVHGYSNGEIADALCISVDTVKAHLKNLFAKLQVRTRTQAAVKALWQGLVSQSSINVASQR